MAIIVQKYGGSSVATPQRIKEVAAKVVATRNRGYDVVVVVSAMGNQTDDLMALARQVTPHPNSRELDMLVTVGERISMALLSMAIHDLGYHAISFTGSQSGIITNDTPGAARILDIRPYRVQDELARGNIVIVAGYQGVSYKLEVTTLGRGGSDTTAVALAAALSAEACEIYSDVDGVYTADPRVVLDAARLVEIDYEEMQELARFGAKVLNPEAVEFARRSGIQLFAKATSGSDQHTAIRRPDGFPDTLLAEQRANYVTGVTGCTKILLVEHRGEPDREHLPDALLAELEPCEILYSAIDARERTVRLVLHTENMRQPVSFIEEAAARFAGTLSITQDLGLVTAVGSRAGCTPAALRRLLSSIERSSIHPRLSFTSRLAVSALIPRTDVDRAVQVVHGEFFGSDHAPGL
ncbi:MAG: aspartate kinase [Bradymonadales bacterium]|nr:aspartate kinase [Bradymonadales bacterium]